MIVYNTRNADNSQEKRTNENKTTSALVNQYVKYKSALFCRQNSENIFRRTTKNNLRQKSENKNLQRAYKFLLKETKENILDQDSKVFNTKNGKKILRQSKKDSLKILNVNRDFAENLINSASKCTTFIV